MSWSVAVGVLSFGLSGAPAQVPPPPTVPPVVVTTTSVPLTSEVTAVPTVPLPSVPLPAPETSLSTPSTVASSPSPTGVPPLSGDGSTATPIAPGAPVPSGPSAQPANASPAAGPAAPSPSRRPGPLVRQPTTRLLAAASDTARHFAPTGAVAALTGAFLAANGAIRRRDHLAHVELDDRDAVVRFE